MVMIIKKSTLSKISSSEYQSEEEKIANDLQIEESAWNSGYYKREPKKISATSFCMGFWSMQDAKEDSLSKWALHTGLQINDTVTKEGINNRLSADGIAMVKMMLKYALEQKVRKFLDKEKSNEANRQLYAKFNRILLQDSTMQKLPPCLHEIFKSSHSKNQAATLRLQSIFDFTNEQWLDFDLGGYTDNDQSKAMMITEVAQKNDLILRDLGYFTLESLEQLSKNQYVITKWSKTTHLFAPLSEQQLDLLELFKGKDKVDCLVHVGSKKRLPLRLVAKKLPKELAAKRIQEAKNDRHSKVNHSEQYYKLLTWDIYLTNVDQSILDIQQVAKLYGLRWYIEILFKAWKSYANFKAILGKSKMTYERTLISIYLMLIRFVYNMLDIYQYIKAKVSLVTNQQISILKFFSLCRNLSAFILNIRQLKELDPLIPQFICHATYEKRKKRKNMQEKYLYFNNLDI